MKTDFPQYRKLINNKSFYCILSATHCIEYSQLGKQWIRHEHHARILPERLFIEDLLDASNGSYEKISSHEWIWEE